MSETATVDTNVVSFVHGVSFANQLKQQKLAFLDAKEIIAQFATLRETGLGNFNPQVEIQQLKEIASKTENFAKAEGEDVEVAKSIFSKLFFLDLDQSPISQGLNIEKFNEGILTFWDKEEMPAQEDIQVYNEYVAGIAAKEGEEFLSENAKRPEVTVTPSGLQYEILEDAEGQKPTAEQTVVAHYEGTLPNGVKFDSSYDRGEPTEFPLNRVIAGWTEGLQLMSVGAKYKFYIPYQLGYGAQGAGADIPPYAALVFIVELKEVK
tara:strand:+ start:1622 stop:2416 length:795 start_codon:yes stop_codon:yes gene_type:complete